jgi:hypothetical protein
MKTGLRHGFVRFDTLACDILKECLKSDYVTKPALTLKYTGITGGEANYVSVTLQRLVSAGLLFVVGREKQHNINKSYAVYALDPKAKVAPYKKPTQAERMKQWRHKKKHQVPSVFHWRGTI